MKVELSPIRPELAVNPSPWVGPVQPMQGLLEGVPCPLCGTPLQNGTPLSLSDNRLAHAQCGGET